MTKLLPRFLRETEHKPTKTAQKNPCRTGKIEYATESAALEGLRRVRKKRIKNLDEQDHECAIYLCDHGHHWHLTSNEIRGEDVTSERERSDGETWESYAKRLERRVAEQRSQILSLHALGHGASNNRQARKRINALVIALGHMTERWEAERANRIRLVQLLETEKEKTSWFKPMKQRRKP